MIASIVKLTQFELVGYRVLRADLHCTILPYDCSPWYAIHSEVSARGVGTTILQHLRMNRKTRRKDGFPLGAK